MNRSIVVSPFKIVHDYKPRKHIDLIIMKHHPRVSEFASVFTSHVHGLHKEIRKKIQESNTHYKFHADLHLRHPEFIEGN